MNSEVWKRVYGFPEYEVSNLGKVRKGSLLLKQSPAGNGGYPRVTFWVGGKRFDKLVSIVVLESFVSEAPINLRDALHRDDNRLNNKLDNLYWGNASQNAYDGIRNGNRKVGEAHVQSKITWDIVREMRRLHKEEKMSARSIGLRFGLSNNRALQIVKNLAWKEEHAPIS